MKKLELLIAFLLCLLSLEGQTKTSRLEQVTGNMLTQLSVYPQEKIHLHLDRDYYVPGDRIWFKVYLVNSYSHIYSDMSRYVYVELINSSDSLVNRVMLRPEEGLFHGHIFLGEAIPEGDYTIRAYTRYMENPDEDYYYKRVIHIGNIPSAKTQTHQLKKTPRKKASLRTEAEDYDVSFFPEGGNLLSGAICRIAFKALNSKGYAENVTGEIKDKNGKFLCKLTTFHDGMGLFAFLPEQGKNYYVHCRNEKGIEKQFELPPSLNGAYSLFTSWKKDRLLIGTKRSEDIKKSKSLHLLIHCRGNILYFKPWEETQGYIALPINSIPSGVLQFILLDDKLNPLSERLVFNYKKEDQTGVSFKTDKENYKTRELTTSILSLTDKKGESLTGNLSVSITDDQDVKPDESTTILSTLLLSSELRGYIESPGYYLREDSKGRYASDLLMMTHGWRRYNLPETIKGNIAYSVVVPEKSLNITGKVKTLFTSKPIENADVTLLASGEGDIFQVETNENGDFGFIDIEYPDSTHFLIQAVNAKGKSNVELSVNKKVFPSTTTIRSNPKPASPIKKDTLAEAFLEKAEERFKYDDDMRVIHLQSVEVVARKIEKEEDKPRSIYSSSASVSLKLEDIEKRHPILMEDLFNNIAGVSMGYENSDEGKKRVVKIRGKTAVIFVDDMEMDNALSLLNVQDVERIDVFKGANAAIFGLRGGNGVVSITTKRGGSGKQIERKVFNRQLLSPLGFQKPVEFYSPKYDTQELRFGPIPDLRTTIFWKPDIITSPDGKASFEFYTSDFNTTYTVVIEGISDKGDIIHQVEKIKVSDK